MNDYSNNLPPNRAMPGCTIIPVLSYPDVNEAFEWLCKAFGFTGRWKAGNHRAQLAFGDGAIAISEGGDVDTAGAGYSIMVRVPDADAHYKNTKQQGASILHQPTDFPYGERQYSVKDIGGHIWTFSQSIADISPIEWGATIYKEI